MHETREKADSYNDEVKKAQEKLAPSEHNAINKALSEAGGVGEEHADWSDFAMSKAGRAVIEQVKNDRAAAQNFLKDQGIPEKPDDKWSLDQTGPNKAALDAAKKAADARKAFEDQSKVTVASEFEGGGKLAAIRSEERRVGKEC